MYILFWFFKQLFYILKRFKLKNFLLLLAFFIIAFFLFIKPSFASTPTTIDSFTYNGSIYYFDYPLTLTNTNNSYYIVTNNDLTTAYIIEPLSSTAYLTTYNQLTTANTSSITNYLLLKSIENNTLNNVIIYESTYNGSNWSTWSNTNSSSFTLKSSTSNYNFITGNNVTLYTKIGSNQSTVHIFTENDLPNNIKFTDNICIFSRANGTTYLLYTANSSNYFKISAGAVSWDCLTSSNTTAYMDIYQFSNNTWTLYKSNVSTNNTGQSSSSGFYYSTNKLNVKNIEFNCGYNDFFYYIYAEIVPFIENSTNTIEGWTFENLDINGGTSLGLADNYYLLFTYPNSNTTYRFNINEYFDLSNGTIFFHIPRSRITQDIVLNSNTSIAFTIISERQLEGGVSREVFDLSSYNLTLTQTEADNINASSDKQLLSDLQQEQQQTTQAVENLENTITDTNISDDSISFPTLNVPDLARDGLSHIFDAFVLAFCSETPEDIILPIPNTNKTITIPYNYTSQMLTNYSPTLLNLVTIFWWYWIARIIVFDIYDKMDKIQSGNVENLQNENITTNML